LIAATRGHQTLDSIGDDDIAPIRDAHLLLAAFNSWQPGVFALSGWDLLGMLTVPKAEVADLIAEGDTRWVERGALDLLGLSPEATHSPSGMPRARSLYGSLPEQLAAPGSFAQRLRRMLELRAKYGIAAATQVDIPNVARPGMLVMVHELLDLDDNGLPLIQITALNFTDEAIEGTIHSESLLARATVVDAATDEEIGFVDDLFSFPISLEPYGARFLILQREEVEPETGAES